MLKKKLNSFALASLVGLALGVACNNDSSDDHAASGGVAGKSGASAGTNAVAGSGASHGGGADSGGRGGSGSAGKSMAGNAGHEALAGQGGGTETSGAGGLGGVDTSSGGQGGDPSSRAGEGGVGGEAVGSCATVRSSLLGPIDSVSTGSVEVTSAGDALTVTARIDASAGGYAAAANNPYIYLSLAGKAPVAVSDLGADSSVAWDLAFKRDNIRSNAGDSGPGSAQVATLAGADFATVTAAAAATADFGHDEFLDHHSCEPIVDGVGKPLTRFDGWYDYDGSTMTLTPADRVYLIRSADGTSLYKLRITGYYVDVLDGSGGTVKKSAVYSIEYAAL